MKQILFIIILIISNTSSFAKATIKGHITNIPIDAKIQLNYYKDFFYIEEIKQIVKFETNGNFKIELDLKENKIIDLRFGKNYFSIFLRENDNLYIGANYNDFLNTISFKGKSIADNVFLINDKKQNIQFKANQIQLFSDSKSYSLYLDSLQMEYIKFYNNYDKKNVSEFVKEYLYQKMKYQLMDNRWMYKLNFASKSGKIEKRNLHENYFNYLDTINLNDDIAAENTYYRTALMRYTFEKQDADSYIKLTNVLNDTLKRKISTLNNYNYRKLIFKGNVLNVQLTEFIKRNYELINKDSKFCDSLMNDYYLSCTNEQYKENVKNYTASKNQLTKGKLAPDIQLVDKNGNKILLSSFKGKNIYIDFWATWCKPCMANMIDSKKLNSEFKNESDIIFLYVNIDDDYNRWLKYVSKQDSETHLFANEYISDNIFKSYYFSALPHYVLIDKNFKIYDTNARAPIKVKDDIIGLLKHK